MKKTVALGIVFILLFLASTPVILGDEEQNTVGKTKVFINGVSHQYKFGSFVHIGRFWWCPNYNIKLTFDIDDSFVFYLDGEEQNLSSDHVSISMDGFFGIAPTLYSFLRSDTVRVCGLCDTISVEEWNGGIP